MYQSLLQVRVQHDYFSSGLYPGLNFTPTSKTSDLIRNADLVQRPEMGGMVLFYNDEKKETLQLMAQDAQEPMDLVFKVYGSFPNLVNVTHHSFLHEEALLYFDNTEASVPSGTGDLSWLHQEPYANDSNLVSWDSAKLKGIVTSKERVKRPIFILCLRINPKHIGQKVRVGIQFQPQQTYWTYYLLRERFRNNTTVLDLDGQVEFNALGSTMLPGNRKASVFRSTEPIVWQERSTRRFQLQETTSKRVWIKRLPVAGIDSINRAEVDGQSVAVSDIYIN